jgi:hypothetical protein
MIQLRNKDTGEVLGTISEDDLQFLQDQLVEESEEDTDYYLNREELNLFKVKKASKELISLLEKGFGDGADLEIQWERV